MLLNDMMQVWWFVYLLLVQGTRSVFQEFFCSHYCILFIFKSFPHRLPFPTLHKYTVKYYL